MARKNEAALKTVLALIDSSEITGKDGAKRIREEDAAKAVGQRVLNALAFHHYVKTTYTIEVGVQRFYIERP